MRQSLHILIGLILLASLVGCDDSKSESTGSTSTSIVSMSTPEGWQRRDNYPVAPGVAADFVLAGAPVSGFAPTILVLTSAQSTVSTDSAAAMEIRSILGQDANAIVDSNTSRDLGGNAARLIQIRFAFNGQQLLAREFLARKAGRDIQIVLTRRQEDLASGVLMSQAEATIRF